jgi:tetratricopeptide (TPR) repeat protein
MAGERTIAVGRDVLGSVLVTGDRVQVTVGAPGPGAEPPAFRVLTLIARPLDSRELPDIAEARALAEGLAEVSAPVYLGFVRPPTPDQLRARLQEGWDVFHFDGHGTAEGGGALALEDEDGLEAPLPARDLADLLRRCVCPRLLILSACQSAGGDGHGLAGHLLRETGAGAVIGFQETVSIETTREFLRPLYAALGAGRTVREAFEAARAALPEEERDLPVLLGERADEPLAPPGRRGEPVIERAPLYGVPAYAEFRFYGDYLPGDPPGGRKGLLAGLLRALRQGERFVVLAGPGGIGKSALAALAAERLAGRFPGGVFWTDGAAYLDRGLNPDGALEVFAAVLGGRDFLTLPWTAKWQAVQALARRLEAPFLWVLDNADVADETVWRLARELPAPSAVLLTTRERPERGGRIFRVDPLTDREAVRLLWTEAHRRREPGAPPLPDDPATWEALAEIVRLLEGHPLALLIVAALVADEGPQEALEAVRADPARGETARRFDFSYNRLPEPERRMLARLAAFAADVDRPIAEAIAAFSLEGGEPDPIPDPAERLRELVRRSFLALTPTPAALGGTPSPGGEAATPAPGGEAATPSPSPAARERGRGPGGGGEGPRYHLHPVLRAYVRSRQGPDMAREDRRMVQFCWILAGMAHSLLGEKQARGTVAWAAAERLNLIGAQEAALEQGMRAEAVDFAYWLDDLFERSGHWDLRRRALENGLKAATPGTRDEAALRHNLGALAQQQGNYGQARQFYQESLRISEELGDRAGVATFRDLGARREQAAVLHQLGMLAQQQGNYGQARRLYEESLRIEEELGNRAGVAQTLHQLGMLAQDTGDYGQARRLYEESLRIKEELGDRAGVAQTLHNLGVLAQQQGDYGQARQFYERAAGTFRDLGARREQAAVLHNLGALAQDTGDYGQARQFYQESLRISEELGDRAGVATTTAQLALLEEAEGNLERALELITRADEMFARLGSPYREQARRVRERIQGRVGAD